MGFAFAQLAVAQHDQPPKFKSGFDLVTAAVVVRDAEGRAAGNLAAGWGAAMPCQFQVGRGIARRAPGRELSACLTLTIVQWIVFAVIGLVIVLAASGSDWQPNLLPLSKPLDSFLQ